MKTILFSSLKLECATRTLSNDSGDKLILRPLPFDVLVYLLLKNAPASREELFENCWGGTIVTDQALTNVISGLRRHFVALKAEGINIQTISKVGYFLDVEAKVVEQPTPDHTTNEAADAQPPPATPPQRQVVGLPKPRSNGKASYFLGAALMVMIAATYIFQPFKPRSPFTDPSQYVQLKQGEPAFYLMDATNASIDTALLREQLSKTPFTDCPVDAFIRIFPSIYEPDVIAMTVRLASKVSSDSHVFQHFNVTNLTLTESIMMAFDNPEVTCDLP